MTYCFGPFRLDAIRHRLWRGDVLIPLTPKAFDTLLTLVLRAGQVVEKEELLKAVWQNTFVEEATLAQNISTIRKALGDTSETPIFIATVPRRGYRFLEAVTESHDASAPAIEPPLASRQPVLVTNKDRERVWMVIAALALVFSAIAIGVRRTLPQMSSVTPPVVFAMPAPSGTSFSTSGGFLSVSPDGRHIAFVATAGDGVENLWLRSLDSPTERLLTGTAGASQPFWSPDSRAVAFFADGKLRKIDIERGSLQTICSVMAGAQPLAGTWNADNDILFSSLREGILRVTATGGKATPIITAGVGDDHVTWPQFLPDGRHFMYVLSSSRGDRAGIYVSTLDAKERTRVSSEPSYAVYVPSGHLLFVQNGTLVAQRFDIAAHRLEGDPVPLAERVAFNSGTKRATFSTSRNGVLAYRSVADSQLEWFDRAGKSLGAVAPIGGYLQFAISPDGTQVAAARLDSRTGTSDIWILSATGRDARRLTFDEGWDAWPLWSRDGSRIVFGSNRRGRWEIYTKASSGEGREELLLSSDGSLFADDWDPAGQLLFHRREANESGTFALLGPGGQARPVPFDNPDIGESSGRISPDGRWLAYARYESGNSIYVRPLASAESRWQISPAGSVEARWRNDGRELFYLASDLSLVAMDVEAGSGFRVGSNRTLFHTKAATPSGLTGQAYDVTPDGQRFLVKVPASPSSITVIVNWTARMTSVNVPLADR